MNKILLLGIIVASLFLVATVVYFSVPSVREAISGPNLVIPDTTLDTTPSGTSSGSGSSGGSSGSSSGSSGSSSGSSGGSSTPTVEVPVVGSAGPATVNLGTAGDFVLLSKSGISTTGTTSIVGDIGVSPVAATYMTGFGLILHSSECYSISSLVTGNAYAADYDTLGCPTPAKMITAVSDMEIAYADAAGRAADTTELGAGDISRLTLTPGVYKWGTGVLINNGVTLSGNSNSVFIFQIAQDLTVGSGAIITLSGGVQAKNIFWQVAGQTTLEAGSNFKGNILTATLVEMKTGATLNGRALAQTEVTLDANAVTKSN